MNRTIKFRAWLGGVMHPIWTRIDAEVYKIHPDIVLMQFTGLLDKNGKEIYEGDVVKTSDGDNSEVIFESGHFCIHSTRIKPQWDDKIEVIGNIYENPELITK